MKGLSLLIKPASGNCNLQCKYCFYVDVAQSRGVKSYGMMSLDTLEKLVQSAFNEVSEFCFIGFQGGEPMLAGLGFFKTLMELEKKYNRRGVKIFHTIQTNGLFIDDEWAGFFADNKFLVGISIDAVKPVHDDLRKDAKGKGTFARCLQATRLLEKRKVDFNVLSVVSKKLALCPDEVWRFCQQHNFRYIQFIACLGKPGGESVNPYSPNAQIYGKFLCRIFDLWYEALRNNDYISVRAFDNYIHILAELPPENCAMSGICNAYALVEANGNVYPCDFYAADKYLLGNIHTHGFEQMLSGKVARRFIAPSRKVASACTGCEYFFLCRGGCRRDREPSVNGRLSLNRYCEAYKMFFKHALPRMKAIACTFSSKVRKH